MDYWTQEQEEAPLLRRPPWPNRPHHLLEKAEKRRPLLLASRGEVPQRPRTSTSTVEQERDMVRLEPLAVVHRLNQYRKIKIFGEFERWKLRRIQTAPD